MFNLEDKKRKGLVQVYTGTGKGKTTAALGLVLRASGKGQKSIVIQFMKGQIKYGELNAILNLPNVEIEQYGRPDFVNKENPEKIDIDLAMEGLERAKEVIVSGDYDIVVLDEMNMALDFNLLSEEEVIDVIEKRPPHVEIVLTGRNASPGLINLADLVTVMADVKHPYMVGVEGREGIEY